jgi:acetylornithine aminotransferase
LMLGVEFDFDVSALRKKNDCWKAHILPVDPVKNLLRILPPLTITTAAIDTFIVALRESLAELKWFSI